MMAAVRIERMIWAVVIVSGLLGKSCASPPETEAPAAGRLGVQVRFTALWWSTAQMEGLDPNNPPPKSTEVELARWEYTDPVGVPHPDVVDVVVTLENREAKPLSDLIVTTEGEWKIGSLDDESNAAWGESVVLVKSDRVQVPAGSTQTIRVPVNVKQMMDALEPQGRWPYVLRARVTVVRPGAAAPLARTEVDFPIRPGN